jgi:hypothetical protein
LISSSTVTGVETLSVDLYVIWIVVDPSERRSESIVNHVLKHCQSVHLDFSTRCDSAYVCLIQDHDYAPLAPVRSLVAKGFAALASNHKRLRIHFFGVGCISSLEW